MKNLGAQCWFQPSKAKSKAAFGRESLKLVMPVWSFLTDTNSFIIQGFCWCIPLQFSPDSPHSPAKGCWCTGCRTVHWSERQPWLTRFYLWRGIHEQPLVWHDYGTPFSPCDDHYSPCPGVWRKVGIRESPLRCPAWHFLRFLAHPFSAESDSAPYSATRISHHVSISCYITHAINTGTIRHVTCHGIRPIRLNTPLWNLTLVLVLGYRLRRHTIGSVEDRRNRPSMLAR